MTLYPFDCPPTHILKKATLICQGDKTDCITVLICTCTYLHTTFSSCTCMYTTTHVHVHSHQYIYMYCTFEPTCIKSLGIQSFTNHNPWIYMYPLLTCTCNNMKHEISLLMKSHLHYIEMFNDCPTCIIYFKPH